MSISDGQPVDAANSNAAWASKTADNTMTGNQELNDPGGGGNIANLQQEVNNKQNETLLDAKGDLYAASAADTAVRIAVGADNEALVADSVATGGVSYKEVVLGIGNTNSTDNAIVRWDGTTGKAVQNSAVLIDDSDNVTIPGNLTVSGTTTQINTTNTNILDTNITINSGGNDASSEGSGLTVERTGTDGSLVYEDALASKFKLGALAAEIEVTNVSSAQTLTNKTMDADNNTFSNFAHGSEVDNPSTGVHGVTGSIVGTTDTQTLTNKTFTDSTTTVQDDGDNSKKFQFQASGITTSTTRTYTVPDADTTLMGNDTTDTMTNKTFDADGTGNSITNIENADIKVGAAIARTKLASGTADHVLINDGSGVMSSEATLAITRGGTGAATAVAAFDSLSPVTTKGDLIARDASNNVRLAIGTDAFVLTADAAEATGMKWAAATGGSGSGVGGKTYVPSGSSADFESTVGDWLTYDNGAVAIPVDGTGGAPSVLTASRTIVAGEVLGGTGSLKIAKTAADAKGEGVAVILDKVDLIDRGKNLTVSFDYLTETNYVSGDWGVYRYDIDGTTIVKISDLEPSSTGGSKFTAVFPTTTGNDDYRLILHMQTTNNLAFDTFFDNFKVGPDSEITTPVITAWEDWTPTGSWVSGNETYTGKRRQVGTEMEYYVHIALTGAPTAATLTVNLPSGDVIDTAQMVGTGRLFLGPCTVVDAGNLVSHGRVEYNSTTVVRPSTFLDRSTYEDLDIITATSPITFANTDSVWLRFTVPLVRLSAGAVVSNTQLQNQTINFGAYRTTSVQTLTAGVEAEIVFNGERYDSHGAYSTSTGRFTAPRKLKYSLRGTVVIATGGTAPSGISSYFKVNGATPLLGNNSENDLVNNKSYTLTSVADVELDVGDYVTLWGISSGQNSDVANSGGNNDVSSFYGHSIPDFTTYGVVKSIKTTTNISTTTTLGPEVEATFIDASGVGFTVTLPSAGVYSGRLSLKKTDSTFNVITIDGAGAQTIDGDATTTLNTEGETLELISDGTNWEIVGRKTLTKPVAYTPSVAAVTLGTGGTKSGYWWRSGQFIHIKIRVTLGTGSPSVTAAIDMDIPSGLTIDTAATHPASNSSPLGTAHAIDSGTAFRNGVVVYISTTATAILSDGAADRWNATLPHTWAASDALGVEYKVPISGWKA